MTDVLLTVGTRKGLFIGRRRGGALGVRAARTSTRRRSTRSPSTPAVPTPRLLVGGDSAHWGPSVFHSDDLGASWVEPPQPAVKFPEDTGASLERVWQLQPAGPEAPGRGVRGHGAGRAVPLGGPRASPSSWSARCGSTRRARSGCRAAAGRGCTPSSPTAGTPRAVTVAVSTAGVFRTKDGGASWAPSNQGRLGGVPAGSGPGVRPVRAQGRPGRGRPGPAVSAEPLGVSTAATTRARSWTDIGEGLPSDFGFAVAAHPHRGGHGVRLPDQRRRRPGPGRAPLPGLPHRATPGAAGSRCPRGCRTGTHYGTVLRDALCTDDADPAGVYFGNRNGEVYASADDGDSWQQLASHLPDVLCVRAAVIG